MRLDAGTVGCALVCLATLATPACADDAGDEPVATLVHFLDLMDRSRVDSRALKDAYALLDRDTQVALRARADKAQTLAGRDFLPWQMIDQGRFRLRFAPSPGGMQAKLDGERATVVVAGDQPGEHAEVPMVKQDGSWRVVLELPPDPPAVQGRVPAEPPGTQAEGKVAR